MKGFAREDLFFSLCGLNCGLCPMKLDGHCPGCGGGAGNQSCKIARCSLEHGAPAYCFRCGEYPCERYGERDEYDSFITHQNRLGDMERARTAGLENYRTALGERRELLEFFLANCNDGRRKTLFYLAASLLTLGSLREIRREAEAMADLPLKERGTRAAALLQAAAEREGVLLKLRKKPR
ncbi:MAG: DUF3795 domain-containing protein [Oscillibacter sp.]|nr:DUF3795 domain-containing protein [Oscillibacter sp.]